MGPVVPAEAQEGREEEMNIAVALFFAKLNGCDIRRWSWGERNPTKISVTEIPGKCTIKGQRPPQIWQPNTDDLFAEDWLLIKNEPGEPELAGEGIKRETEQIVWEKIPFCDGCEEFRIDYHPGGGGKPGKVLCQDLNRCTAIARHIQREMEEKL